MTSIHSQSHIAAHIIYICQIFCAILLHIHCLCVSASVYICRVNGGGGLAVNIWLFQLTFHAISIERCARMPAGMIYVL